MLDWLSDHSLLISVLTGASVLMFIASLVLAPMIVVRIPPDYFAHQRRPPLRFAGRHPALRLALRIARNALAAVLLLAGLAMLVLPGQGLLTLFVGFVLLDFPRKYAIERWLISRRLVRRPINWLRRRRGRAELARPSESGNPPASKPWAQEPGEARWDRKPGGLD